MKKSTYFCRIIICIGIFTLTWQTAFSQIPEIIWEKQIPINYSHYFSDVLELPGENFILLGAIEKPSDNSFDIWILECNKMGDTLKTKVFENPGNDIPMRIIANGENKFLVAYINNLSKTESFSRLLAFDSNFTVLWTSPEKTPTNISRTDIALDNENQIWWLNTITSQTGKSEISLLKLNSEGNKTAEFKFEENNPVSGYAIRTLTDGTLAISCQVQPSKGKPTVKVIRVDTNGKELWKTLIPQTDKIQTPQCLCCSPDNTLLVGGWSGLCFNPDAPAEEQIWDYDYLLSKLDATGKIIWTQNYTREGSEKGTAITVLPDGKILATGKCETSFTGNVGPWLLLIDKNGKMIKDKVFKLQVMHDQSARIVCTSDGGFLMVGPGYVETGHKLTGWVKKLNPVL